MFRTPALAILAALLFQSPALALDAPSPAAGAAPEVAPPPPELPPDPNDPLEKLYGRKQLFFEKGTPTVTVRLMEGQKQVSFVPKGRMRLTARGGLNKTLDAPGGSVWTIRLKDYEPGEVVYSVQVAELRQADREGLVEVRKLWEERGFAVRTATSGSLYGIAGRVLDNRHVEVYLGGPTSEEAGKEQLKQLHQRFGFQATLASALKKRPHGLLELTDAGGTVVAIAQDLCSATSPEKAPFTVKEVEHGVGYSWHGRQDRTYRGDLEFVVDRSGGIAVVNSLPLEAYLRGIISSEIFAKSHPEALKAQAVTARGEVLAKLGTRHLTDPYLLCAEQHCQVYTGVQAETANTDAAVQATAGEVLFASGGLVDSVYSAVCGGHTEDNDVVWGGMPDPALRGRPDLIGEVPAAQEKLGDKSLPEFLASSQQAYCQVSTLANPKKYRWERRFTQVEVDEIAAPFGVGHVAVVAVAKRGSSGRASVLTIAGEDGATQVRGELNIRKLFKNLNSAMFVVEPPDKGRPEWIFRGGGWGHGVGMCQVGAVGRAEKGQGYREILRHYFNGAEVVAIY